MEQHIFITMSPDDLRTLVKEGVIQAQRETAQKEETNRTYSINQASKILGRSFTTVKNLIMSGKIKTISDGKRITALELNNYLREPG